MKVFNSLDSRLVKDILVSMANTLGTWTSHHSYLGESSISVGSRTVEIKIRDYTDSYSQCTLTISPDVIKVDETTFDLNNEEDRTAIVLTMDFDGHLDEIQKFQKALGEFDIGMLKQYKVHVGE